MQIWEDPPSKRARGEDSGTAGACKQLGTRVLCRAITTATQTLPDAIWAPFKVTAAAIICTHEPRLMNTLGSGKTCYLAVNYHPLTKQMYGNEQACALKGRSLSVFVCIRVCSLNEG